MEAELLMMSVSYGMKDTKDKTVAERKSERRPRKEPKMKQTKAKPPTACGMKVAVWMDLKREMEKHHFQREREEEEKKEIE